MNDQLELQFVEYKLESFIDACSKLVEQGKNKIRLRPFNQFAADFSIKTSTFTKQATFYAAKDECVIPLPPNISLLSSDTPIDATILFVPEAKALSALLMEYIDLERGSIIAPITEHYYKNKPLFLISIPKSGTHLLYELAEAFGYAAGIVCPDNPSPGTWYCLEYSNSHTSARDFFIDTVRRSHFGNRDHPFTKSPAIFIYRNPLDIVVSEANYYHQDGKTVFYSYLNSKSFEERLMTLINDPWLLGSIRDRIGNFIAWLDFQNVIPVSFEELVGPNGGGDFDAQTRLIWSLQLKLHVSGNPQQFGDKVFNKDSPTFGEGQIGSHKKYFADQAYKQFYALPQDFMVRLGYDFNDKDKPGIIPKRADEFRRKPVLYSETSFDNIPLTVEFNYLGFNILKYKGLYYIVPDKLGGVNLTNPKSINLKRLHSAKDLKSAKQKIFLGQGMSSTLLLEYYARRKLGKLWLNVRGSLKRR